MRIFAADHVLPISSAPIKKGAIAVEGLQIAAVGDAETLKPRFPNAVFKDFGEAAIIPGFVNCHSHLEITVMRGLLDHVENDFSAWLLALNAARQRMSDEDLEVSAVAGAIEGARAGVTCFGDIGRFGKAGLEALKATGLRGIVFQETEFSPDDRTADEDLAKLQNKFFELRNNADRLVKVGISPHSPYTVGTKLFEGIADFALAEKIKVTIHAAESEEECSFMENGEGFWTDIYKKFGFERQSPRCTSIEFLERTGILQTKPLLAHCVTVSDSDIELIRTSDSTIAHCPKSNAKFGHGWAPLDRFLKADISVGLGSDSVASNNTCDLLEESRFAAFVSRNRGDSNGFISARDVLELATLGGAEALGLDEEIGSLETGKQADIAVISLSRISKQPVSDIHAALVFSSGAQDVIMTMVAGRKIFAAEKVIATDENQISDAVRRLGRKLSI
ncbi:MAG: amidohydrolase family protein [Acidobacteriota bacterium]